MGGRMNTVAAAVDAPASDTTAKAVRRVRITSIDVMRGLVIVLMMVDHVRERFFYHILVGDPVNLEIVSTSLFFTRLSAHLCAPVFVFLAGLGAWLYANPKSGVQRSPSYFLFTRGLFLLVLEVVLINTSWFGEIPPETIYLQVIWAIGLSMVVLSAMVRLPYWAILSIGLLIVFGHNALTPISFEPGEFGYSLWTILHDRGVLYAGDALTIKISYPTLPWVGVILLGYSIGPLYGATFEPARRIRLLVQLGVACLLLLMFLRGFNIYGETLPWTAGTTWVDTLMSMLNYTKYPPSLDFLLLTLGVCLLLMAWLDTKNNPVTRVLLVFGQAPMFIYALHLYVLLFSYRIVLALFGPKDGGLYHIDYVWQIWILTAILAFVLYFPTRAFGQYKRTTDKAWVKYF